MIKLGVNSVLFAGHDLATAAKWIKACGYDGIEISAIAGMCEHLAPDRWRDQAEAIAGVARHAGLALLSMEVASLEEARLEQAFAACQALGIPVVNVGPGGKANESGALEASVATLAARAALAGRYGVTLCCKAHVGAAMFDTRTTLAAMERITHPAFGIDMDPSHVFRAGENPVQALPPVLQRCRHIHIRDCKGRGPSPGEARDQACGRGDIDLFGYCRALVDGRYAGPVCLEIIGAGACAMEERVAIAAESYGYLNACLRKLGAR